MRAGGVEKAQKGYCMLGSLGCDRVSGSMSRHGSQAVGGCWVAIRVFLVETKLFFFYYSVMTGVPTVSRQCFIFCRDNVATEVPLVRSRRSR